MNNHVFQYEGEPARLDRVITEYFEMSITRSFVKKSVLSGNVTLNGRIIEKCGVEVAYGDVIEILLAEPLVLSVKPENIPLDIVYQDADIVVINKQQGLTVHPSDTQPEHTLVNALMYHIKDLSGINGVLRPGIVHRIDKNTSGLLVVAKNDMAHLSLSKQIADKTARRSYLALCDRNVKEDSGTLSYPLSRDRSNRLRMAYSPTGRQAVTHFNVLERFGDYTYLALKLETGRTHQIRAHLKEINHPIVGDKLYGGSNKFALNGQLLHAAELVLIHPRTGVEMTFKAELPDYFNKVLEKIRLSKA